MATKNSIFHRTNTDNLISNLRGEVGEIVESWILMRELLITSKSLRTGDSKKDFSSPEYLKLLRIIDKFKNDIISRLSELSEKKVGQVNFNFATRKLSILEKETESYQRFIIDNKFLNLRHEYISHKNLPPTWKEHKAPYRISNLTILKGIAKALMLMKEFDKVYLGVRAKFLWYEMRKRRYDFSLPFSSYLLLPHLKLTEKIRIRIAKIEESEGKKIWENDLVKINGHSTPIKLYKELGLIKIENNLIALPEYPISAIKNIDLVV